MNIETKVEAGSPEQSRPRDVFAGRVWSKINASGLAREVTIQSLDWDALRMMHPSWSRRGCQCPACVR